MTDWNSKVQGATERAEDELKRFITYINDEVVPDVRREGSSAIRKAAEKLHQLAQSMDDRK